MSENTDVKKYDVIVPPGVPRKIIYDISEKFDVEVVDRPQEIHIANMEGDVRNLIAFRCDLETAKKVEAYLYAELKKFIDED